MHPYPLKLLRRLKEALEGISYLPENFKGDDIKEIRKEIRDIFKEYMTKFDERVK